MTDRLEITDPADGSKQTLLVATGVVHLCTDGANVVLSARAEGAELRIVPTKHGRRLEPLVPGALIEVSGQQLFCKDLAPGDRFEFAGKRLVWHSEVELPAAAVVQSAASRSQRRSADGKPTAVAAPGRPTAAATARDDESERARPRRTDRSSRPLVFGLIRQESRFWAEAVASAGALGLMQVMPATGKWIASQLKTGEYRPSHLGDVTVNTGFGAYYLRTVLDQMGGSEPMAAASYNAGPGRARAWRASVPLEGAIYAESIPFNETRDYVKKVLANAVWYAHLSGSGNTSLKQRLGIVPAK